MKFETTPWRIVNRDWKVYAADNKWIIDLPDELGKAYKFKSLETEKAPKKSKKK